MSYFVFLEFRDVRIVDLLAGLRAALSLGAPSRSPIHVTLRGPYAERPEADQIRELSDRLRGHGVRIFGSGAFATSSGFAVYLRAESTVFRELWWKPDYPSHLGLQPHVTLFEAAKREQADAVLRFLQNARIFIYTHDVELSVTKSKQEELFGPPFVARADRKLIRRDWITTGPDVLGRARALGARLRTGNG
jgi:hypothetical protein